MSPEDYDLTLVHARDQVARAAADMRQVVGTSAALGVWMRKSSYQRALTAQEHGLHHTHRTDLQTLICTCGLRVPVDTDRDPLNQPGHLDRNLREVRLVMGALRTGTPPGPATCLQVHCSHCPWTKPVTCLGLRRWTGALHLLLRHPRLLPTPRRQPTVLS